MKTKRPLLFTLMFLIMFLSLSIPSFAVTEPNLSSAAYILVDMETGQVLAEKNADEKRSPASTTKIMTALVALEHAKLDDEMTASDYAINSIGYDYVTAGIKVGETLKFENLLDLMLITSANEASNIIAENVAEDGTLQGFTALMNQKAAELGMTGTHFTNSNGTEDENHYTTARDLAILAREAMKNETFRSIVGRKEFDLPATNLRKENEWKVGHLTYTNQLLDSRSSSYKTVTGIKTGYTDKAGRCLVSSAINPDGLELVSVILGAPNEKLQFTESQTLLEFGFKNYSMQELVQKGKYIDRFEVQDAVDGKKVEILTNSDIRSVLPKDKAELEKDLQMVKTFNEPFVAPIAQGQVVGKLEYIYKGKSIGTVDLVAKEAIEKTTIAMLRDKYREIISDKRFIFGVKAAGIIILAIIILGYILRMINRRNKRRKRYNYSSSRKNNYRF